MIDKSFTHWKQSAHAAVVVVVEWRESWSMVAGQTTSISFALSPASPPPRNPLVHLLHFHLPFYYYLFGCLSLLFILTYFLTIFYIFMSFIWKFIFDELRRNILTCGKFSCTKKKYEKKKYFLPTLIRARSYVQSHWNERNVVLCLNIKQMSNNNSDIKLV